MFTAKLSKIAERHNENTKNIKAMLKKEFLELTHKTDDEVSDIDYSRIEALYNELDSLDKQEFCHLYTDDVPNLLSVAALAIRDLREHIVKLQDDKDTLTQRFIDNDNYDDLKGVYTTAQIIKMKISDGDNMPDLTDEEVDYIKSHLQ